MQNSEETPCGPVSRRRLLRTTTAAVAGAAGLGAIQGAAGASDCWYEHRCRELICPVEDDDGGLTELRRECCEQSDGTVECSDWTISGCCSSDDVG